MIDALLAADRAAGLWLAAQFASPVVDTLMITVSVIGTRGGVWIALALATWLVAPAKRMAAWRMLLALGLAGLLVDGMLKPIVARDRPFVDHPGYRVLGWRPETRSFPSGHAATAAAGALAFTRIWPTPAAALTVWPLAALIALSRITLGVHFPTDVIAGALVGSASAWFVFARPPTHDRSAHETVVRATTAML